MRDGATEPDFAALSRVSDDGKASIFANFFDG